MAATATFTGFESTKPSCLRRYLLKVCSCCKANVTECAQSRAIRMLNGSRSLAAQVYFLRPEGINSEHLLTMITLLTLLATTSSRFVQMPVVTKAAAPGPFKNCYNSRIQWFTSWSSAHSQDCSRMSGQGKCSVLAPRIQLGCQHSL